MLYFYKPEVKIVIQFLTTKVCGDMDVPYAWIDELFMIRFASLAASSWEQLALAFNLSNQAITSVR